eukprot:CAMPEP_0119376498 /NCGR_PEP_ID=MMETSP1334-20130426/40111_1 /TAXON_ID=127549 /ORGANISM="Calcidiscus leptoporus, Strain RCC1130" /LENGTH=71 /DNA_ID=CAMNT_0007395065 /DNA_START=42 /DNA_END=257 /DNA_ORIENTATION=+
MDHQNDMPFAPQPTSPPRAPPLVAVLPEKMAEFARWQEARDAQKLEEQARHYPAWAKEKERLLLVCYSTTA